MGSIAESLKEFGNFIDTLGDHMEDGLLEEHERRVFGSLSDALIGSILRVRATYHAINESQNEKKNLSARR